MIKLVKLISPVLVLAIVTFSPTTLAADEDETEGESSSPLAIQQEGLSAKMGSLQEKLLRLTQQVRKDDPARADAMLKAIKQTKEKNVRARMKDISRLLNEVNFDSAASEQKQVIQDIKGIIETLTKRDSYYEQLQKRIKQLEKWRKKTNQLSREEWNQKRQSEKMSNLKKSRQQIAEQIKQIEKLRKQQKSVLDQTEQTRKTGKQNFGEIKKKQNQIQKKTDNLAKEMSKKGSQSKTPSQSRTPEPGEKSLKQASKHQKQSSKNLAGRKGASAANAQKKSLKSLSKALKQMKGEKKRLDSMSPKDMKKMAEQQKKTQQKTQSLQKQMKSSKMGSAKKSLQSASSKMSSASQQLNKKNAQSASGQQKKAHKKLQKAREDIDKKLSKLRKQQQDALLSKLIEMFTDMLKQQKQVTKDTAALNKIKTQDEWGRAQSVRCDELADSELNLRDTTQEALKMMMDNGSPVVFPQVVRALARDLKTLGKRLDEERTGASTKMLQKDVEQTLQDFIGALKMAKDNPPPEQKKPKKGKKGKKKKPPLINVLAELKLLRNLQKRVNARTDALSREKPEASHRQKELDPLADRQERIRDMAVNLRKKITGQSEQSQDDTQSGKEQQ